ncbi:hypothetical protein M9Y10_017352 [Tritrichomonas musculus]|uniref:Uncharacterized protein n=1 Tax=Tritrichomonas musculus TaxID=1915356 RepID=A0ABR2HTF0_9EUKA
MSERQINIFPYAFNLASLIIAGNQTNPLIKDFLKQFPISSNDQANNQSLSTDKINNFAGIEAQLDEDKDIKGITSRIDEISNQRGDDLYKELKDYPVKRVNSREQELNEILKEERKKRIEQQTLKEQQIQKRKDQFKHVNPEDLQKMEQEHNEKVKSIYQSQYVKELQKPKISQKEVAQSNRNALVDYGKEITKNNKDTISKKPKKLIKKPEKQEKLPPPFATDLNDWNQRISSEIKELSTLRENISTVEKFEVNLDSLYRQITDSSLNGTDIKGPDYHMQFAMLFQKLENAEQKIKELEEKTDEVIK